MTKQYWKWKPNCGRDGLQALFGGNWIPQRKYVIYIVTSRRGYRKQVKDFSSTHNLYSLLYYQIYRILLLRKITVVAIITERKRIGTPIITNLNDINKNTLLKTYVSYLLESENHF